MHEGVIALHHWLRQNGVCDGFELTLTLPDIDSAYAAVQSWAEECRRHIGIWEDPYPPITDENGLFYIYGNKVKITWKEK